VCRKEYGVSFKVAITSSSILGSENVMRFEQMDDLFEYLRQRVAQWNNFEVEQGKTVMAIVIEKPAINNALDVNVAEEINTTDRMG
jgi:LPS sulfotransferase NodH